MGTFARVIVRDCLDQYLLVRHRNHPIYPWNLPGGKILGGETTQQAAARETLEETGVTVLSLNKVLVNQIKVGNVKWVGHYFVAEMTRGIPFNREPSKLLSVGFKPYIEIEQLSATPGTLWEVVSRESIR